MGTAWDMDKWPLALFYLFAGVSTLMFMMSTIFAVIQILMVYEMSDEAVIEQLMDLIASEAQLPGQLLFLGLINFCVPVALYLVYTINLGIGDGGKIFPGPKYPVQQIMASKKIFTSGCMAIVPNLSLPSPDRGGPKEGCWQGQCDAALLTAPLPQNCFTSRGLLAF